MSDLVAQLNEQLQWHWENHARPRLDGLTDEEYLWLPSGDGWTVRRRGDEAPASVNVRAGTGEWLLDYGRPAPEPPPVTSIAWRAAHIVIACMGPRTHSHFGGPRVHWEDWDFPGTAAGGLAQLDEAYANWIGGVAALRDEDLWRPVGPAEGPWHESPMITLVLHINREAIHHLAEIALLRDLWAHRA